MKLNVSTTDPEMCRKIAQSPEFTSIEMFKAEPNGHKFKPGDVCTLTGLESFPEHNGDTVKILSIRANGSFGRAYYVEGLINEAINWVYEYRLI